MLYSHSSTLSLLQLGIVFNIKAQAVFLKGLLTLDAIELIPILESFSDDPINPLLATQEAHQVVERAKLHQTSEDALEFNASSGTPAMKTAWSVLQALGYASMHSHVWQVRNPKEMRPGQERVFYSDVNLLRDELDLKLIKQQVQDYNYSGALVTLQASNLCSDPIQSLLKYGYYRLSMDFNGAFSCLGTVIQEIDPQEDEGKLLTTLHKLMKQVTGLPDTHPFDRLNQQICALLDQTFQITA